MKKAMLRKLKAETKKAVLKDTKEISKDDVLKATPKTKVKKRKIR